jgi:hypothetical protein
MVIKFAKKFRASVSSVRDNLNCVNTNSFDTHWMTRHMGINVPAIGYDVERERLLQPEMVIN